MTQADRTNDTSADFARRRNTERSNRRIGWMLALVALAIFVASMLARS